MKCYDVMVDKRRFTYETKGGKYQTVCFMRHKILKGGQGISPCTMHHLKTFSPGLENVLFRTLSYRCRVPDKFPRSDDRKMTN